MTKDERDLLLCIARSLVIRADPEGKFVREAVPLIDRIIASDPAAATSSDLEHG